MRDALIQQILSQKEELIKLGFDWPTQSIEEASNINLVEFLDNIKQFRNDN